MQLSTDCFSASFLTDRNDGHHFWRGIEKEAGPQFVISAELLPASFSIPHIINGLPSLRGGTTKQSAEN